MSVGQKTIAVITLLSLTLATFASPSAAASTGTPEGIQLVAPVRTAFPNANKGEY